MKFHPATAPEDQIIPCAHWPFQGEPIQRVLQEYFKEKAKWAKDGVDPERNQSSPITAFNSWLQDWSLHHLPHHHHYHQLLLHRPLYVVEGHATL